MLFYKQLKGDPKKPETLVLSVEDMHLMDIGSSVYTEFDHEAEDLIALYDKRPELMEYRCGLIHSHHNMDAFFSGTDMDELYDNSTDVDYYLSLIVNNDLRWVAKIATKGIEERKITSWLRFPGFSGKKKYSREENISVLAVTDMDIFMSSDSINDAQGRYREIKESIEKKKETRPANRIFPPKGTMEGKQQEIWDTTEFTPRSEIKKIERKESYIYDLEDSIFGASSSHETMRRLQHAVKEGTMKTEDFFERKVVSGIKNWVEQEYIQNKENDIIDLWEDAISETKDIMDYFAEWYPVAKDLKLMCEEIDKRTNG